MRSDNVAKLKALRKACMAVITYHDVDAAGIAVDAEILVKRIETALEARYEDAQPTLFFERHTSTLRTYAQMVALIASLREGGPRNAKMIEHYQRAIREATALCVARYEF